MSKVIGGIVAIIGLAILVAGACAALKPERSLRTWAYREATEDLPGVGDWIENPGEGDIIAKIGSYVVEIHHSIGILDPADATTPGEMEGTAQNAGIATAGFGIFLMVVGGLVSSAGGSEVKVVKTGPEQGAGR